MPKYGCEKEIVPNQNLSSSESFKNTKNHENDLIFPLFPKE